MYKITPDMILKEDNEFIILRTYAREECCVCNKFLYRGTHTSILRKDCIKVGDAYYEIHSFMGNGICRELFKLTPYLYV